MEWVAVQDLPRARELFHQGSRVPRPYQHPPLYEAWARMEAEAEAGEGAGRAEELLAMGKAVEEAKQKLRTGRP